MTYDIGELNSLKRQWIFTNSNIPRRFIGSEPADVEARTGVFPALISEWIEAVHEGKIIKTIGGLGTTGLGLLFDGAPGLGKTTHAVIALMELIRTLPDDKEAMARILGYKPTDLNYSSRPIYYMTFPEFLSRKKALFDSNDDNRAELQREMEGFHGRAKEDHLNVRVLVLDDLGKEYNTSYNDTSFDEILRARYDKALPTIITTNVDRDNWGAQYGSAMGSFAHEAFYRVVIKGKDLRQR